VDAAQASVGGDHRRPPDFFRAPADSQPRLLDPVLAARGLRYVSGRDAGFDAVSCANSRRNFAGVDGSLAAGDTC